MSAQGEKEERSMSDPHAWLEERQALADAATDGPREAEPPEGNLASPTQGTFVEVFSWTDADAEFIADARQSVPAMAAALTAVLDLHRPMGIYSMEHGDCDHADPESCPPVDTDAGAMCGDSPDYYACEECMDVGGELTDSYPEHPCGTVKAITAALKTQALIDARGGGV